METPYDKLAKIYTNCSGHMTKVAAMPLYGKTLYQKDDDLRTCYVAFGM